MLSKDTEIRIKPTTETEMTYYAYVQRKDGTKEVYEHVPFQVAWEKYAKWHTSKDYTHVKFGKHDD